MQHEPHEVVLIDAHFHEVISRTQRSQVLSVVGVLKAWVQLAQRLEFIGQRGPCLIHQIGRGIPGTGIASTVLGRKAMRHGLFDRRAQRPQVIGQIARTQRGLGGHHSATDIHTDSGGDDCLDGGNHGPDGCADSQMHVGHCGDVFEHHRQLRRIGELLERFVFHGHALGPHLHGDTVGCLGHVVVQFFLGHFVFLFFSTSFPFGKDASPRQGMVKCFVLYRTELRSFDRRDSNPRPRA